MIGLALVMFAFAGFIAYMSLVAGNHKAVGWMPGWLQSLGHLACYAVLAFLLSIALAVLVRNSIVSGLIAFVLAVGFGLLMEYLQRNRPGRTGSYADAGIDAAGALLGVFAALATPLA